MFSSFFVCPVYVYFSVCIKVFLSKEFSFSFDKKNRRCKGWCRTFVLMYQLEFVACCCISKKCARICFLHAVPPRRKASCGAFAPANGCSRRRLSEGVGGVWNLIFPHRGCEFEPLWVVVGWGKKSCTVGGKATSSLCRARCAQTQAAGALREVGIFGEMSYGRSCREQFAHQWERCTCLWVGKQREQRAC